MEEQIAYCHHCGNKTGIAILYKTESMGEGYNVNNPEDTIKIKGFYYLAKCRTCEDISLFYDCEFDDDIGNLSKAFIFYPQVKKPGDEIPSLISETFKEALKVEKISPLAFGILVRRALELLCKDKAAIGNNLKQQLDDLVSKKVIPDTLAEMADTLRILGNLTAHTEYKLDFVEVESMKDFIIAMLEFVYVAPAKINKVKDSIKRKKNDI